jgi:hypothetical protein
MSDERALSELSAGPEIVGLSVIVPCFNEAENVESCYQEIIEVFSVVDHRGRRAAVVRAGSR